MKRHAFSRLAAGTAALALVVAACGGDDDDDAADDATEETAEDTADEDTAEETAEETADDGADEDTADDAATEDTADDGAGEDTAEETADDGAGAVDLASVCPSPLVVQTDWFPESEHGTLYEMMGDDYEVDVEQKVVTGSLVTDGGTVDTGIDWQVRAGGPAIGFSPTASVVYTDDNIHLAYQNTEAQVLAWEDTPMISVLAPLEKNPQMIMWDPETYPDVESIADLGTESVTVNIFGGGSFADVFVAQGIWNDSQVDPSYDGSPARFIAEGGAIAQQGFASAEPYNYENVFEEWGRPVAFQLLHDAGFEVYSQTIAVRPDRLDELSPCLEAVVPIMQQATVDFADAPERANAIIIDTVERFADFWVYDEGIAAFSVATMKELGLKGNGPDSTVGNMEADRIQGVIDAIGESGIDIPEGLSADDLHTNEFIDMSIGF